MEKMDERLITQPISYHDGMVQDGFDHADIKLVRIIEEEGNSVLEKLRQEYQDICVRVTFAAIPVGYTRTDTYKTPDQILEDGADTLSGNIHASLNTLDANNTSPAIRNTFQNQYLRILNNIKPIVIFYDPTKLYLSDDDGLSDILGEVNYMEANVAESSGIQLYAPGMLFTPEREAIIKLLVFERN